MNLNNPQIDEDQPLDPAVERVRRKMMRLMGISVAIMMVGLMAVIGAIFYKISGGSENKEEQMEVATPELRSGSALIDTTRDISGTIELPAGAQLMHTQLDGDRILLNIKLVNGKNTLWIYDLVEQRVFADINIQ